MKIFKSKIMTQLKNFWLNGEEYHINKKISLLDLIDYFSYNNAILVLEYNGLICNKTKWKKIFIEDEDKIEIVTIVGGG